jgi:hypothetical protein
MQKDKKLIDYKRYFGKIRYSRTAMLEGDHLDEKIKYQYSSKNDTEHNFGMKVWMK